MPINQLFCSTEAKTRFVIYNNNKKGTKLCGVVHWRNKTHTRHTKTKQKKQNKTSPLHHIMSMSGNFSAVVPMYEHWFTIWQGLIMAPGAAFAHHRIPHTSTSADSGSSRKRWNWLLKASEKCFPGNTPTAYCTPFSILPCETYKEKICHTSLAILV